MAASERIPKEKRKDIIRVVMSVKQTTSPNPRHLVWLFEVYNAYLSPNHKKDIDCRTHRATVINDLYRCVILWKKQDTNLQR